MREEISVEYDSNNSGGHWWLTNDNWRALEAAGWEVEWEEKPFLGALARRAVRRGLSIDAAIVEFERITGADADDEGCPCCGPPHEFFESD